MAKLDSAEKILKSQNIVDRGSCRNDARDRFGDVLAFTEWVVVVKVRLRIRKIRIRNEERSGRIIIGEFDSIPNAGAISVHNTSRVTAKKRVRIRAERPE